VENLRLAMASLQVATVASQVSLSIHTDFEQFHIFKPGTGQEDTLGTLLNQVVAWGSALRPLRS
jgi:hypothetical protein